MLTLDMTVGGVSRLILEKAIVGFSMGFVLNL
jgi:hypothetical protein